MRLPTGFPRRDLRGYVSKPSRRAFLALGLSAAAVGAAHAQLPTTGVGGGGFGGASGVIAAPFTVVNGPTADPFGGSKIEGWSVNYAAQPTITTPVPFTVARQGYSATDSASANTVAVDTSILDTFYVTNSLRQPWPNNASQSALSAILSDYIYSTDTPSGSVTNNCTLVSPKPIMRHGAPGRRTVGNSVRLEVPAFHKDARNGKQVCAVVFTATDGTHTVTRTVATPSILSYSTDQGAVIGYGCDLDITALNDNASFTVDIVGYPWIGASTASQRRTVDGTAGNDWEFATQTYYKSTSKAGSPPLAYIISGGVDAVVDVNGASGGLTKVSTTAATAKANGFASLKSAIEALKAATNVTGGFTDGCEIRISNCTVASGAVSVTAGTYQSVSELVITRDPAVARASCVLSFGASATNFRNSWIKIKDLTVDRAGGTSQPILTAPGQLVIENCDFNNSSRASQFIASATVNQAWIGVAITNGSTQLLGASTTPQGLIRGCTGSGMVIEIGCVIGNAFTTCQAAVASATNGRRNNAVMSFNKFPITTTSSAYAFSASLDTDGLAVCQNSFEYTSSSSQPVFRPSGDGATGNITHMVQHNNTFAGAGAAGRQNGPYDEATNVRRVHKFISIKGNIWGAGFYTKGDIFHGTNDGNPEGYTIGSPSQAIGQWPVNFGVGCDYNFSQYATPNGVSETQFFPGRNSLMGAGTTSSQIASFADLWTSYQGVAYNNGGISTAGNYTAGAGSGTYTLTNSVNNIAKGIVKNALFNFTLDGVSRSAANDNPGAFSAAA